MNLGFIALFCIIGCCTCCVCSVFSVCSGCIPLELGRLQSLVVIGLNFVVPHSYKSRQLRVCLLFSQVLHSVQLQLSTHGKLGSSCTGASCTGCLQFLHAQVSAYCGF